MFEQRKKFKICDTCTQHSESINDDQFPHKAVRWFSLCFFARWFLFFEPVRPVTGSFTATVESLILFLLCPFFQFYSLFIMSWCPRRSFAICILTRWTFPFSFPALLFIASSSRTNNCSHFTPLSGIYRTKMFNNILSFILHFYCLPVCPTIMWWCNFNNRTYDHAVFTIHSSICCGNSEGIILPVSDGKFHENCFKCNLWNGVIANDLE